MSKLPNQIITPRLVLRPYEVSDIPAIVRGLNNWNVARWLGRVPHPYVPRHARGWVAYSRRLRDKGKDFTLGFARRDGRGEIIGAVGVHNLLEQRQPCGYWLAEPHWGKGYTSEAVQALLSALFEFKPEARPVATALPDNLASINVLQKAGFAREIRQSCQTNLARGRKMRVVHFTYAGKGAVSSGPETPSKLS